MGENTALVDVSASPMELTYAGRKYLLPPLQLGDIALAERYIVKERVELVIGQTTRMPPLPDEVRALAISNVVCKSVLLADLLLSAEGRVRLLFQSMVRADKSVTWVFVTEQMPALPTNVLTQLMYKLAGLDAATDDEADPTQATTPEHGEPQSGGTKSSPGSAADST